MTSGMKRPPLTWEVLTSWQNFQDVENSLSRQRSGSSKADDLVVRGLQTWLGISCPEYDFSADSVQKVLVSELGLWAEKRFVEAERARLMAGVELTLRTIFGPDWRSRPFDVRKKFAEFDLKRFGSREIAIVGENVMASALAEEDFQTLELLFECIRKGKRHIRDSMKLSSATGAGLPVLNVKHEIIRNWTNPDYPLWLMTNSALKQAVLLMTAGQFIDGKAIDKALQRGKLIRNRRRPIRMISVKQNKESQRFRFESFTLASYIKTPVPAPERRFYGECGGWVSGRWWR